MVRLCITVTLLTMMVPLGTRTVRAVHFHQKADRIDEGIKGLAKCGNCIRNSDPKKIYSIQRVYMSECSY